MNMLLVDKDVEVIIDGNKYIIENNDVLLLDGNIVDNDFILSSFNEDYKIEKGDRITILEEIDWMNHISKNFEYIKRIFKIITTDENIAGLITNDSELTQIAESLLEENPDKLLKVQFDIGDALDRLIRNLDGNNYKLLASKLSKVMPSMHLVEKLKNKGGNLLKRFFKYLSDVDMEDKPDTKGNVLKWGNDIDELLSYIKNKFNKFSNDQRESFIKMIIELYKDSNINIDELLKKHSE